MNKVSKLSEKTLKVTAVNASQGQGMDRIVEKKDTALAARPVITTGGPYCSLHCAWWFIDTLLDGRSLSVDAQRIAVSTVTSGTFEDYVPLRGRSYATQHRVP